MGVVFNRLTLVEHDIGRSGDGHRISLWLCECGEHAEIAFSRVKSGATKSCGCLIREANHATHRGRYTSEYSSWMAMRRRCLNADDKDYPRYGGRGITVCAEWAESFAAFRDHMGARPGGTTLDRIDSNGHYEPGNCQWSDTTDQARNRRNSLIWHIKGQRFESISDAAKAFSVSEQTIHRWVNGAFDARRNSTTMPRHDCSAERKYA